MRRDPLNPFTRKNILKTTSLHNDEVGPNQIPGGCYPIFGKLGPKDVFEGQLSSRKQT